MALHISVLNRAVARFRTKKTEVLDVLVTKKAILNFAANKIRPNSGAFTKYDVFLPYQIKFKSCVTSTDLKRWQASRA